MDRDVNGHWLARALRSYRCIRREDGRVVALEGRHPRGRGQRARAKLARVAIAAARRRARWPPRTRPRRGGRTSPRPRHRRSRRHPRRRARPPGRRRRRPRRRPARTSRRAHAWTRTSAAAQGARQARLLAVLLEAREADAPAGRSARGRSRSGPSPKSTSVASAPGADLREGGDDHVPPLLERRSGRPRRGTPSRRRSRRRAAHRRTACRSARGLERPEGPGVDAEGHVDDARYPGARSCCRLGAPGGEGRVERREQRANAAPERSATLGRDRGAEAALRGPAQVRRRGGLHARTPSAPGPAARRRPRPPWPDTGECASRTSGGSARTRVRILSRRSSR